MSNYLEAASVQRVASSVTAVEIGASKQGIERSMSTYVAGMQSSAVSESKKLVDTVNEYRWEAIVSSC